MDSYPRWMRVQLSWVPGLFRVSDFDCQEDTVTQSVANNSLNYSFLIVERAATTCWTAGMTEENSCWHTISDFQYHTSNRSTEEASGWLFLSIPHVAWESQVLIEAISFLKEERGRAWLRNNCKIQLRIHKERGREVLKQRWGKE